MPARDEHLSQAQRFEGFLSQIERPDQPYREWLVIVRFHIALHYVDAFLASKGHLQIEGHSDRWTVIQRFPEMRAIESAFKRLYKDAKEARYDGGEFTSTDIASVDSLYQKVRTAMRSALGL